MKVIRYTLLALLGFLTPLLAQTLSKNSALSEQGFKSVDLWFTYARTGNWEKFEKMHKETKRDWDFKSSKGLTALMMSSRNGQHGFMVKLLKKNINVNMTDEMNYNALSYSLHGPTSPASRKRSCAILLRNGADAFSEDQIKQTPIQLFIEYGFLECIRLVKFTVAKPCDQAARLTQILSIVKYAEDEKEPEIATYLKSQGCQ